MKKIGLYHGCHNTFAITDYDETIDYGKYSYDICTKHKVDGFIAVKQNPLEMVFYNADGSRAPMCGNGIRCMIKFCYDNHIVDEKKFDVLTLGGIMKVEITSIDPFMVLVNFGKPNFSSKKLLIDTDKEEFIGQNINVLGKDCKVSTIFLGTNHTVVFINDVEECIELGEPICNHKIYLEKTNVNFVKIINRDEIFVKTYERGVGWTKACGSGASSSFVVARLNDYVNQKVKVHFEGGIINVMENANKEILMEGPAELYQMIDIE